jgi:hypothetical protein
VIRRSFHPLAVIVASGLGSFELVFSPENCEGSPRSFECFSTFSFPQVPEQLASERRRELALERADFLEPSLAQSLMPAIGGR